MISTELLTLYRCAAHDLILRYHLIKKEVIHLLLAISYRTSDSDFLEKISTSAAIPEDHKLTFPIYKHSSDEISFLLHLFSATVSCWNEVIHDQKDVIRLLQTCKVESQCPSAANRSPEDTDLQISYVHLFLCYQAAYRLKANTLLERVGNLHDRFEQFFQRVNPDHPGSSLRHHSEQGAHDKYLTELTRWVHIDLAHIAGGSEYLGGPYPYEKVPSTFHTLDYPSGATVHSFQTHKHYQTWKNRDRENKQKLSSAAAFVTVRLPFLMSDISTLQPILGHELAHQILRDIYGRGGNQTDALQTDKSELGRTMRRLHDCIESWGSTGSIDDSSTWATTLPNEIMCDVLATIRFREAYIYTLFLSFLEDDSLAELVKDQYGMLRRLPEENQDIEMERKRLKIKSKILRQSDQRLLRSYAVLGFVKESQPLWGSKKSSKDMVSAFGEHIDQVNALFSFLHDSSSTTPIKGLDQFASRKQFGKDIAETLCRNGPLRSKTDLLKSSKNLWQKDLSHKLSNGADNIGFKDPFRFRQQLSKSSKALIKKLIDDSQYNSDAISLDTAHELPWQIDWLSSVRPMNEPLKECLLNAIDLSEEDFIYRTSNPDTLFQLLGQTRVIAKSLSGNQIDSKSEIERSEYFRVLLDKLNKHLKATPLITFCTDELSYSVDLSSLGGQLLFDASILEQRFNPAIRFELQLISFTLDEKKSVHDNSLALKSIDKYASQTLLGRYDRFFLRPFGNEYPLSAIPFATDDKFAAYSVKSRTLIPLNFNSANPLDADEKKLSLCRHANESSLLIKLGLHWPGARHLFPDWLNNQIELINCEANIYLSTGWEDFVVFVKIQDDDLKSVMELIQKINANRLVNFTETFWTRNIFSKNIPKNQYRMRFLCRMSSIPHKKQTNEFEDANQLQQKLLKIINNASDLTLNVYSAYGDADYEVCWEGDVFMNDNKKLLDALYEIPSIHRIETKILCRNTKDET